MMLLKMVIKWKIMFFGKWHKHTQRKKTPNAPKTSCSYDLPINTLECTWSL